VTVYRHGDVRQHVTGQLEVPIVTTRKVIAIGGTAILAAVVSVALLGDRYELISLPGDGSGPQAYKLDKRTGRTWLLFDGTYQEEVEVPKQSPTRSTQSPEDQALQLAANYTFPGSTESADVTFKRQLQTMKGVLRIYGWHVKKVDDQSYVVGYTYDQGPGSAINGWVFEVNLKAGIVRDINGDPDLEKKYGNWAGQKNP
jgi:hypothetical protein